MIDVSRIFFQKHHHVEHLQVRWKRMTESSSEFHLPALLCQIPLSTLPIPVEHTTHIQQLLVRSNITSHHNFYWGSSVTNTWGINCLSSSRMAHLSQDIHVNHRHILFKLFIKYLFVASHLGICHPGWQIGHSIWINYYQSLSLQSFIYLNQVGFILGEAIIDCTMITAPCAFVIIIKHLWAPSDGGPMILFAKWNYSIGKLECDWTAYHTVLTLQSKLYLI